ncbi:proton-conducting transporter membrane subunit [Paenibacillus herberti]|uniref:Na+/H+ antiporter subunit D n=1 Tax=Paenibacillus herberti TaxID=1619309 RepID=A0A229P1Y6_9BACL|nr:proton-conducting transporter membrane subunit [Paenibacillus herberti]OXM16110.1 Na+/H+ antiporter subunit D [Paenibacillus herberti]
MNNLVVLPLLLPLCTAVLLLFFKERIQLQRIISAAGQSATAIACVLLLVQTGSSGIQLLAMGGWAAPYGIVFTADFFAALLVTAATITAGFCLAFSFGTVGSEREKFYFYPFFQFLMAGVNGSFLTGDLFNLFVCFEVLLISSYALLVLGGTKGQLRATLSYMLINILSSTLFVAAVAYLYGVTGTLNMAHLSVRIAEAGQGGILNVIAVLFLIVFSLKAGLFLFFWLPSAYQAPPPAVSALFAALLTKVGIYALVRTFTLLFPGDPGVTHVWIAWMAGATMILGAVGALASKDVMRILNFNIVISVGFVAFGLAVANEASLQGVVFYLLHDMAAKALLFLLGGMMIREAGADQLSAMGGLISRAPWLGWMFLVAALAAAGIPPLSGFGGKLLLLQGGLQAQSYVLTAISLFSSLIVLYTLVRLFIKAFWGEQPAGPATAVVAEADRVSNAAAKTDARTDADAQTKPDVAANAVAFATAAKASHGSATQPRNTSRGHLVVAGVLCLIVVLMGVGSEWMAQAAAEAARTLVDPSVYIEAVLKE